MDQKSKKKIKKAHQELPPLPQPPLKKEKTYHGNYADEDMEEDDNRYFVDKNKSKSLEQFSKKTGKKRKNYTDYDNEKYDDNENHEDSENENQNEIHLYNNPDYVFNFDDFDTGKRPDAFYDEGDHDPIFEKLKIQLNTQSANDSVKVSLRSNSAPFNNKIVQQKKEENTNQSVRKRQHSEAVMHIHDQQNQFKFSSDSENNKNDDSEPKVKKKTKKKSRKGSGGKKKTQLDDDN